MFSILDFWHAIEHVWELGRVLYRQPASLLKALQRRRGKTAEQKETLQQALDYLEENAKRMNYCQHLAAGHIVGSGQIEAACKSVVGARLKQAGMRWSNACAVAVPVVSSTLLNGDSESLTQLAKAG